MNITTPIRPKEQRRPNKDSSHTRDHKGKPYPIGHGKRDHKGRLDYYFNDRSGHRQWERPSCLGPEIRGESEVESFEADREQDFKPDPDSDGGDGCDDCYERLWSFCLCRSLALAGV